jgi:hypothetical protein
MIGVAAAAFAVSRNEPTTAPKNLRHIAVVLRGFLAR